MPTSHIAIGGNSRGSYTLNGEAKLSNGNVIMVGKFGGTLDFSLNPSSIDEMYYTGGVFIVCYDINRNPVWKKQLQKAGNTFNINGIIVDANDNFYLLGDAKGIIDFDPSPSESIGTANSIGNGNVFIAKYNSTGDYLYHNILGSSNSSDYLKSATIDYTNNLIIVGQLGGTTDFNTGPGTYNLINATPSYDGFVAKYDQSGAFIWANKIGGAGTKEVANAVTTDNNGNIFVSGTFSGTTDFDYGTGVTNLTSSGDDIFLMKILSNGTFLWAESFGAVGTTTTDYPTKIVADTTDGSVYVSGFISGTTDFDPGPSVSNITRIASGFIAKYDNNGLYIWAKSIGNSFSSVPSCIRLINSDVFCTGSNGNNQGAFFEKYSSSGVEYWRKSIEGNSKQNLIGLETSLGTNFWLIGNIPFGQLNKTADYDPYQNTYNVSGDTSRIYIAEYRDTASLFYVTFTSINHRGQSEYSKVFVDEKDNIIWTGSFTESVDLDPGNGSSIYTANKMGLFLQKLDTSNNLLWNKVITSTNSIVPKVIKKSKSRNNYIIAGNFAGTVDFDPGLNTEIKTAVGTDIFIANYDSIGNLLWVKVIGGFGDEDAGDLIFSRSEEYFYFTGYFQSAGTDFDPGTGISIINNIVDFYSKWDINGNLIFVDPNNQGGKLCLDKKGNIIRYSSVNNSCIGNASNCVTGPAAFIMKSDSLDNLIWVKFLPGNGFVRNIEFDAKNTMYVVGFANGGTIDIDPSASTYQVNSALSKGFFGKYNENGDLLIAKAFFDHTELLRIIVKPSGIYYIHGSYNENYSGDFQMSGSTPFYSYPDIANGTYYNFVIKYDTLDNLLNFQSFKDQSTSTAYYTDILLNSKDKLLIKGLGVIQPIFYSSDGYSQFQNYSIDGLQKGFFSFITSFSSSCVYSSAPMLNLVADTICQTESSLIKIENGFLGDGVYWGWYKDSIQGNPIFDGDSLLVMPNVTTTYKIRAEGGCLTNSPEANVTIVVNPLPNVLANTSSNAICAGDSVLMYGIGANQYTWSSGVVDSVAFTPNNTATYYLTGIDTNGCTNIDSAIVTVNTLPTVIASTSDSIPCYGTSIVLNGAGADSYSWSNGVVDGVSFTAANSENYFVTGTDINGCIGMDSIRIVIDSCNMVWPGDANYDGIANNNDLLELGLRYGSVGTARSVVSNNWQNYLSANWGTDTISTGYNLKHADCNGDGSINLDDTLAINLNYGLTHTLRLADINKTNTTGDIYFVSTQAGYGLGQQVAIDVYLGESTSPLQNFYGAAFIIDYNDNTLVQPGSLSFSIDDASWVGTINTDAIRLTKPMEASETIDAAICKTNHINTSGAGKIGTLRFIASNTIGNFSVTASNAYYIDNAAMQTPLTSATYTININTAVGLQNQTSNSNISIYPNPNNGSFTLSNLNTREEYNLEVKDVLGRTVYTDVIKSNTSNANIKLNQAAGVYWLQITSKQGGAEVHKVVVE